MELYGNRFFDYFNTRVTFIDKIKSSLLFNKKKINIGWCSVFPPTDNGVATLTYYFVKELAAKKNVNMYAIPINGRVDKRLFSHLRYAEINDKNLDLVIVFCLGSSCKDITKYIKTRFIIWQTVHDPLIESSEKSLFEEIKQISPDMVITMSRWAEKEYRKKGMENLTYIPAGVDITVFKPDRPLNKEFNIFFLGRAENYKGIIQFLQAVPPVLKKYSFVKFFLHSPMKLRPASSEIYNLIMKTKELYPQNFTYHTSWDSDHSNLIKRYRDVNLLVLPSNNEGFGIPLIEAMGCGIPCLVVDKPPMNEIVINGQTGFCIPFKGKTRERYDSLVASGDYSYLDYQDWAFIDPSDIAEKVSWFIEHPADYKNFSENARTRVVKEYNLDKSVKQLLSIIEQNFIHKKSG